MSSDPLIERFMSLVVVNPDGCWTWTGAIGPKHGYGTCYWKEVRRRGLSTVAHRALYCLLVGPVPSDLQLDHLCRVRHCVNPDHLEPVTHAENSRRGIGWAGANARKTHCPRGHPYDVWPATGHTARRCRTCDNAADRRYRLRRKGSSADFSTGPGGIAPSSCAPGPVGSSGESRATRSLPDVTPQPRSLRGLASPS